MKTISERSDNYMRKAEWNSDRESVQNAYVNGAKDQLKNDKQIMKRLFCNKLCRVSGDGCNKAGCSATDLIEETFNKQL